MLLDLSAVFDTIDHHLLIDHLSSTFGIRDIDFSWFISYLQNRCQIVIAESLSSRPSPVCFGVSHGSVLRPVLFILYTQSLSRVIERNNLKYHSFADSTQLYISAKPEDFNELLKSISTGFSEIMSSSLKPFFFHLRCIAATRRYLTSEACVKLVLSLIFSRFDYCNSLLT